MEIRAGISEQTDKLIPSLVAAQKVVRVALKRSNNDHFKKSYADLGSVWAACRDALTNNELCVTQLTDTDGERVVLITTLLHISGQWIRGVYPVKPIKADPQAYGSALTYARRYALASIVGVVAADEDDDANAASEPQQQAPQRAERNYQNAQAPAEQYGDIEQPYAYDQPDLHLFTDQQVVALTGGSSKWNLYMEKLFAAATPEEVSEIASQAKGELAEHEYKRFRQDAVDKFEALANPNGVAAQ